MELEEFPYHILEKIKYTWETWNSPPRLSSDSLHLDEIEEMNLDNRQEGTAMYLQPKIGSNGGVYAVKSTTKKHVSSAGLSL
ncbi:hypothetical protein Goshw_028060 [Gossypium schwendimanii]|uniref:Uncharacterized protein n=1 Tax=Gossypium schwendimanii TaxID=34291 RepID=A0A7J9LIH8_GOSSC|nr:hypothetical protein [Gossypium schwendimanii]